MGLERSSWPGRLVAAAACLRMVKAHVVQRSRSRATSGWSDRRALGKPASAGVERRDVVAGLAADGREIPAGIHRRPGDRYRVDVVVSVWVPRGGGACPGVEGREAMTAPAADRSEAPARVDVEPDTASASAALFGFGFHAVAAPVRVSSAARQVRGRPPIEVNAPPA